MAALADIVLGSAPHGSEALVLGLTSNKASHPAAVLAQKSTGAVGGACMLTLVGELVALELVGVLGVDVGDEYEECHEGEEEVEELHVGDEGVEVVVVGECDRDS